MNKEAIMEEWDPIWRQVNLEFEEELVLHPQFECLSQKMFFVWEGNHRTVAWQSAIQEMYSSNKDKHCRVLCTVIDATKVSEIALLTSLQRMNM